jgi:hypothetical protein
MIRFDTYELDPDRHLLSRDGEAIHLSPKALQLLGILIDRAPNAMSKRELHELLWPAVYVSETNLAGLISEVRAALSDRGREHRYIRTVHGFGYAFATVADAVPSPAPRRFRVVVQGRDVALSEGAHIIGRSPQATVLVQDDSVSREHARIVVDHAGAHIHDLGSKNGTYVNGTRLTTDVQLQNRDVIAVGTVHLTFVDAGAAQSTVTVARDLSS